MFVVVRSLDTEEYRKRHKQSVPLFKKSCVVIRYNGQKTIFTWKSVAEARANGSLLAYKFVESSALLEELTQAFGRASPQARTTFFVDPSRLAKLDEILARYPDMKKVPKIAKKIAKSACASPVGLAALAAAARESSGEAALPPLAAVFNETAASPVAREIESLLAKKKRDTAEIVAYYDSMIESFGGAECGAYLRKTVEEDRDRKISYVETAYEARYSEIASR